MNVPAGWLLTPLVLALLSVGTGLLIERAAGLRLPGALLPGVGLAGMIVVAGLLTRLDATAELAPAAVAVVAAAGLLAGTPWRDPRLPGAWQWPLLVAVGAYALFAAPSVLTGQASIAGYVKLDDSATWLALTDHVFSHGHDLADVLPSTYRRTLDSWLAAGYPVGSMLPLGVGAKLTGQDPAGTYQSTIAVYAAILALGLYACARPLVRSPGLASAAALVAVQASLFAGYAQWGGIKEAATAALIPPLAFLASAAASARTAQALAPLCVVAAGLLAVLGLNGLTWVGPAGALALGALAIGWWRRPRQGRSLPRLPQVGVAASLTLLLLLASLPALLDAGFLRHTTAGAISAQEDLGNLSEPLSLLQGAGLWPAGDFRARPDPRWAAVALAIGGLLAAAACFVLAFRRRSWSLAALIAITVAGAIPALVVGSPWVDAKALAVVAPVLLLAAASLTFVALRSPGQAVVRVAGLAGAAALVAGCTWSTVALLGDVNVAPRERLAELHAIAPRIAGEGPTLVLDFEIYAQRHFLREADPEGATDLRFRRVARTDGRLFPTFSTAEVDDVATNELWAYRTIVRRRSPVASRPPSAFRRRWAGAGFEVWQRDARASPPLARLPLGSALDPTGVPSCRRVRALARMPGARVLAAVVGRSPVVIGLARARAPVGWHSGEVLRPGSEGSVSAQLSVPEAGSWRLWLAGGVRGRLQAEVRGLDAGSLRHELSHAGQWLRFRRVPLAAGRTTVELSYAQRLRGGAGGAGPALGPIALTPRAADDEPSVLRLPPRDAARLCDGRRYDWIEALK